MADRLIASPDHVAVAVPDFDVAHARWHDELGGRTCSWFHNRGRFRSRQYRFRGGAKLELIQPSEDAPDPAANFVRRFLDRHGSRVHHVTLKVDDLLAAVDVVRGQGYDVVDVEAGNDFWHEAFLRPSQVGGLIVQIAWARHSDAEWAQRHGVELEPPPADGAVLLGPLLRHPDLEAAIRLWTTLGGEVTRDGDGLTVAWPDGAPLTVRIEPGDPGPVGLRFRGSAPRPADPALGAAVLAAD